MPHDAISMKTFPAIRYSSGDIQDEAVNPLSKLKAAMIAEGSLIAAAPKLFLGCLAVVTLAAADMATEHPVSYENLTLKTVLVIAIIALVRAVIVLQKKNEVLYERLSKREKEKADGEAHSARHNRP